LIDPDLKTAELDLEESEKPLKLKNSDAAAESDFISPDMPRIVADVRRAGAQSRPARGCERRWRVQRIQARGADDTDAYSVWFSRSRRRDGGEMFAAVAAKDKQGGVAGRRPCGATQTPTMRGSPPS
jgi:hypothetical protein